MARKLRGQYPGAIYHPPSLGRGKSCGVTGAMNRRDHSEEIFLELSHRELWLATLSEACQKTAVARVA